MSAFARYLARLSWWWLLCLMRQRWMKRLQGRWLRRMPPEKRELAQASLARQNRLARRHGLALLTLSYNLLLASIALTVTYYAVLSLYSNGFLNPPSNVAVRR